MGDDVRLGGARRSARQRGALCVLARRGALARRGFPWGTLFVNVAGSFAIGVLAALVTADGRPALGGDARAFVMVGILGGFTTFSSFSLETLKLARSGALGAAGANVASVAGAVSRRRMARLRGRGRCSIADDRFSFAARRACQ